ncbi:ImmA/IrrE family metallo-endopeptidase [Paenibacillus silvae]|uniref:ImmA/IrrE family metallo-endopeptidase n=1 Tax=Paenibacillus silvae TaxID=1325358 RepID=UPI002004CB0D|nr:ImmA/IrrE family metallo-endopeptidase [Paenibacillus silvae]MCK6075377.1 ImmA/IrrE family metallo-endopeptidase [Paenibacillus silvae]MCK6149764.1 ImmA/IrrE family metallo-endopeptidase [Paenibacillus silvae]MCK6268062.1 ImmA/IrrE family metallo-endopeptidase [Paenibacillus silvae]
MATRKVSPERAKELHRQIAPIASEYRKKFLDENEPVKDTFHTLEQLGYFIVRFPTDNNLSGFHIKKSGFDCIFVNSAQPLARQYFSAWHECYHAYTGEGGGITLKDALEYNEIEFKAECFAGCILLPEPMIREYIRQHPVIFKYASYNYLIQMQNYFRVSLNALLTRLSQIYPEAKAVLGSRYSLSLPSRIEDMKTRIREANGDENLIFPTNDFTVSQRFFENLHNNLDQDRISSEKAYAIMDMIETLKEKYES